MGKLRPLAALTILLAARWTFVHSKLPVSRRVRRAVRCRAVEELPKSKKANELVVGSSYVGKVRMVNQFGAIVDLGLDKRGWLHRRNMEIPEGKGNLEEFLKIDDELTVRIRQVKREEIELAMRDMPEFQKKPLSELRKGDEFEGIIKTPRDQGVFVDVGAMVDAFLPARNLKGASPFQFQAGKTVKVKVETVTSSRITLALVQAYDLLGGAHELELSKSYEGKVVEVNQFGATLDLGLDKPGWLHKRNMEIPEGKDDLDSLKEGDELTVRIRQVKPNEVELTMVDQEDFQKKPLSKYKEGQKLEGPVKDVIPQGVFVDVGAMVDAFLPKRNLKDANPDSFEKGKVVRVKVEKVTNSRITLALDKLLGRAKDLVVGTSYIGKVVRVNEFGVVMDLGLDKPGWLHKRNMEIPEGKDDLDFLKKDNELTVRIKQVKPNEVELTMFDLPEFQKTPLSKYKEGQELEGTVKDVFIAKGVFVDVGAVVDAFLPNRNLKGAKPDSFEKGQAVKVKVEKVTNSTITLAQAE